MRTINQGNNTYSDFLSNYALYTKFEVQKIIYPRDLHNSTFKFFCKKEKDFQTFELEATSHETIEEFSSFTIPLPHGPFPKTPPVMDFIEHYLGNCKSCNKYKVSITVYGFAEDYPNGLKKYFLKKVGQLPAPEINPDKEITDFLNDEDINIYKKALMNLQFGFGIGAFSYFRRIIENEIKRIVEKIAEIESPNKKKINDAINKYKKQKQMSNLIKAITPFMPHSLIHNGDNILLTLYNQLSGGLHSFSEEICLTKAKEINILLIYLIKKINEEKNEIGPVKAALKKLK